MIKEICENINFFKQCRKYNIGLWQCPTFLFLITGIVTISAIITTYFIGTKYANPEIVVLIVIGMSIILLVVSYLIIHGFERLAEANRMKSEFVSVASHQLRTPLTSVKWALNIIDQRKDKHHLDGQEISFLKDVEKGNQRMIDLVNDLLNVSRIEQGRLFFNPKKTSFVKIVQQKVDEYRPIAKAKNIKLTLKIEDLQEIPLLFVDPQSIKLAVNNLIDNAVKYSREKGEILVRLEKDKKCLRFSVRDHGVGIPKTEQKKIFDKFFRSQNILKYQTEGTGLGLFIAKAAVESYGGKMNFKSQEGKGSLFWFAVPIKQPNKEAVTEIE